MRYSQARSAGLESRVGKTARPVAPVLPAMSRAFRYDVGHVLGDPLALPPAVVEVHQHPPHVHLGGIRPTDARPVPVGPYEGRLQQVLCLPMVTRQQVRRPQQGVPPCRDEVPELPLGFRVHNSSLGVAHPRPHPVAQVPACRTKLLRATNLLMIAQGNQLEVVSWHRRTVAASCLPGSVTSTR
jgi:hypothetical protein